MIYEAPIPEKIYLNVWHVYMLCVSKTMNRLHLQNETDALPLDFCLVFIN